MSARTKDEPKPNFTELSRTKTRYLGKNEAAVKRRFFRSKGARLKVVSAPSRDSGEMVVGAAVLNLDGSLRTTFFRCVLGDLVVLISSEDS